MRISLEEKIGTGGFAQVWRASDELGRQLAVKIQSRSSAKIIAPTDHATALARVNHPNVVTFYGMEKISDPRIGTEEVEAVVMEYVAGPTLEERLRREPMSVGELMILGRGLIGGIGAIHEAGLVHQDLHANNIIVGSSGLKVIDILYDNSMSLLSPQSRIERTADDIKNLRNLLADMIRGSSLGNEKAEAFRHSISPTSTLVEIQTNFECIADDTSVADDGTHRSDASPKPASSPLGANAAGTKSAIAEGGATRDWRFRPTSVTTVAVIAVVVVAGVAIWLSRHRLNQDIHSQRVQDAGSRAVANAPSTVTVTAPAQSPCREGYALIPAGRVSLHEGVREPSAIVTAFCMGIGEVTVGEYLRCVDAGECPSLQMSGICASSGMSTWTNGRQHPELPLNCVNWIEANTYCTFLHGSLASEAQWKRAGRGDSLAAFPWGNDEDVSGRANACGLECSAQQGHAPAYPHSDGWYGPSPRSTFSAGANAYGVTDLVGNLWEWTDSLEVAGHRRYPYRGGSWSQSRGQFLRLDSERNGESTARFLNVGFRCVSPVNSRSGR